MLEAFNELMADPTSRAELVGGLVEVLIFIIPAGAYALSFRIPQPLYAACATAPIVHASSSAMRPTPISRRIPPTWRAGGTSADLRIIPLQTGGIKGAAL